MRETNQGLYSFLQIAASICEQVNGLKVLILSLTLRPAKEVWINQKETENEILNENFKVIIKQMPTSRYTKIVCNLFLYIDSTIVALFSNTNSSHYSSSK